MWKASMLGTLRLRMQMISGTSRYQSCNQSLGILLDFPPELARWRANVKCGTAPGFR
jgi:hypothetical protein